MVHAAIGEAAGAVDQEIGHERRDADAAANRAVPVDALGRGRGLEVRAEGVLHTGGGVHGVMHVRGLNVGLDAENQPRRELPVVANLAAAQTPFRLDVPPKRRTAREQRPGPTRAGELPMPPYSWLPSPKP